MPITTVPTGIFCQPYRLALMVAASSTFQTIVKATTVAEAMRSIHYPDVELYDTQGVLKAESLPPLAVISDEAPLTRTRVGTAGFYNSTTNLILEFQFYIPTATAAEGHQASAAWFMTQTGSILTDMEALARTGTPVSGETHLNLTAYSRIAGPMQFDMGEGILPDPDLNEYSRELWFVNFNMEFMG